MSTTTAFHLSPSGGTEQPRRVLAAAALILAVAAITAGRVAAQDETRNPIAAAKEVAGLLVDNKARCSELAKGQLERLRRHDSEERRAEEIAAYLAGEARREVETARNTAELADRLVSDLYMDLEEDAIQALRDMVGAQGDLCRLATEPAHFMTAPVYDRLVRDQVERFHDAVSSLPSGIRPSAHDQRKAFSKYFDQTSDPFGRSGAAASEDDELPQMSEREYRRKKEAYAEWLEEQERSEAELAEYRTAQRAAAHERRQKARQREQPKVDLTVPLSAQEREATRAEMEAMETWHTAYLTAVLPVKTALGQYLQVQRRTRSLIMLQACQDLSRAVREMLEEPAVLKAPDPAVAEPLNTAFTHFKNGADACIVDRLRRGSYHMEVGEKALVEAAAALERYSLGCEGQLVDGSGATGSLSASGFCVSRQTLAGKPPVAPELSDSTPWGRCTWCMYLVSQR